MSLPLSLTVYLLLRLQLPTSSLLYACHDLHHTHVDYWESKFKTLTVQNKFLDIVTLGHMSFMEEVGVWLP